MPMITSHPRRRRHWPTYLVAGICLAVLMIVSPVSPVTPLSYIEVQGTSMEPAIASGDLVVLGRSGTYEVGDVVAFRDASLGGSLIVHRIIDERDGLFLMRGDNNAFIDEHRPHPGEILGRQIIRIPAGATIARKTAQPLYIAIVAALGMSLLMPVIVGGGRRRRASGRRRTEAIS